uniref:Uncharacterized protein n=1 Tax=Octopus bimaculoides TaxID=37653 RepID=A0A0L8G459_OCTBM
MSENIASLLTLIQGHKFVRDIYNRLNRPHFMTDIYFSNSKGMKAQTDPRTV